LISESVVKLSIVRSVVDLLAEFDPEIMDGMENQLEFTDDTKYKISVEKVTDDQ